MFYGAGSAVLSDFRKCHFAGHFLLASKARGAERREELGAGEAPLSCRATGTGFDELNNPNSAELLENGHILIADELNNRVIEITPGGSIVQTFTEGGALNTAAFASRLPNGHTLISDAGRLSPASPMR